MARKVEALKPLFVEPRNKDSFTEVSIFHRLGDWGAGQEPPGAWLLGDWGAGQEPPGAWLQCSLLPGERLGSGRH